LYIHPIKGYRTRSVPSGKLALEAAESEPPELILLDIHMPEIDGYEVCRLLKENEKVRDIPVLFLSALSETTGHKPVFSHEKSRAIIVESSGAHFDPSVMEAFCRLEEQFREVRDSMED
jgi:response regulator RpfG family c-di-GMP phosphodiesterase